VSETGFEVNQSGKRHYLVSMRKEMRHLINAMFQNRESMSPEARFNIDACGLIEPFFGRQAEGCTEASSASS
jgi:hypothetical protein